MNSRFTTKPAGKVFLAGAGPGDPELLTIRVHRLLREANVILHDDLVSAEVLALAGPQAMVVNVGKRCGTKNIAQSGINELMIDSARRHLKVLRLKSGDPTIFGRLNEEIDALAAANIEFEIVPGITAGAAAAASLGVSMTDRRTSSRVIITSGHRATGHEQTGEADRAAWRDAVRNDETILIYMPGGSFAKVSDDLLAAGLDLDTPCALVSKAGTAHQSNHWTTLAALRNSPVLPPPTILLIGRSLAAASARARAAARLTQEDEYLKSLVRLIDNDVIEELRKPQITRRSTL